jgi:casein kinase I family protein HRR25
MVCADNPNPIVFLINFSLAQLFCNPAMYLHVPFSTDSPNIGTLPFLSINSQHGFNPSRHNDLESLAYTIIYSACGDLSWMAACSEVAIADSDWETILQMKTITAGELCEGLPTPFCKFVSYVYSLAFDKKQDYQYLHSILLQCLATETSHLNKQLPLLSHSHVIRDYTPISSIDQV